MTRMNDRCNSQPKEALSFGPLLGLIIAELVTNAAKHAFHGRNGGLVRAALFNINESWVCVVSDNGVGTATASVGSDPRFSNGWLVLWAGISSERQDVTARGSL
jgi:hypothetical protein